MSEAPARHIKKKLSAVAGTCFSPFLPGRDNTATGYSWCFPSCFGSRLLKVWSLELVIMQVLRPRFRLPEPETQGSPVPAALSCPLGRLPAAS